MHERVRPSDPHAVLGVAPGASPKEIARAYREAAKRWHPDRAGEQAAPRMAEVNAAYELLRDGLAEAQLERLRAGRRGRGGAQPPRTPGDWLAPAVRRSLGTELLAALERGEDIRAVADAATWDSHDVRVAVTDRRLLWLRDDAITDRVRWVAFGRIREVQLRPRGRWRRTAELRVRTDGSRRLAFGELRPDDAERLHAALLAATRRPAR